MGRWPWGEEARAGGVPGAGSQWPADTLNPVLPPWQSWRHGTAVWRCRQRRRGWRVWSWCCPHTPIIRETPSVGRSWPGWRMWPPLQPGDLMGIWCGGWRAWRGHAVRAVSGWVRPQPGCRDPPKGWSPAHHPWAMPYRESHGCMVMEDPREGFTLSTVCLLSLLMASFDG